MQFQPGMSNRDMLQSIAFERLTTSKDDGSLEKLVLVDVAQNAVSGIQGSVSRNATSTVGVVKDMVGMGLAIDSPRVIRYEESSAALDAVLIEIGECVPKILRGH